MLTVWLSFSDAGCLDRVRGYPGTQTLAGHMELASSRWGSGMEEDRILQNVRLWRETKTRRKMSPHSQR